MIEAISIGDPPIEIRLRRNARARRMTLRHRAASSSTVLTLPPGVPLAKARSFVLQNEGWLRSQIEAAPGRVPVRHGLRLPFRGREVTVLPATDGRSELRDGALLLTGASGQAGPRAAALLREAARERCVAATADHAGRLGRKVGRITLRDPRARWGSCTSAGDLMFSWRLILAPDSVLDYVAAHEAAHLVHMDHSPRFWAAVAGLCPDYAEARAWLRRNGPNLLRYDFSAEPAA